MQKLMYVIFINFYPKTAVNNLKKISSSKLRLQIKAFVKFYVLKLFFILFDFYKAIF